MKEYVRSFHAFCLMVLLCVLLPAPAHSAMVEVRPTLLSLTPAQHTAILSVINPGDNQAVYQIRLYRWQQNGDKQNLEPTNDIIASPPMISMAGHATQIVRIGMRDDAPVTDERTYRLVLEEIPNADARKNESLNVALHISLPLFVRPQALLPPPQLTASMHFAGKNTIVTVVNKGHFTARIANATLTIPAVGTQKVNSLTYILPNGWNAFSFLFPALPPGIESGSLVLQADDGEINLDAPVVSEVMSDATALAAR